MPLDAIIVVICVVAMFATFAVTMLWANFQTRQDGPATPVKRRSF